MTIINSSGRFLYKTFEGMFLNPTAHRKTFEEPTSLGSPLINSDLFARTIGSIGLVVSLAAYASGAIDDEQYSLFSYSLLTANVLDGVYEFIIRPRISRRNKNNTSDRLEDNL
jgi:hypothetical protein